MRYFSKGTLRKSPVSQSKTPTPQARWWLVVDLQDDLGKYYRHMYNWHFRAHAQLIRPAWSEHITVVRNEEPPNKLMWDLITSEIITFEYSTEMETDGKHVWLPVWCDALLGLRGSLGLKRDPLFPLHLTIGVVPGD